MFVNGGVIRRATCGPGDVNRGGVPIVLSRGSYLPERRFWQR